ncbi:hypothetical protein D3C78_950930 [compost metagenome]
MKDSLTLIACANKHEAAGNMLQVISKIFCRHNFRRNFRNQASFVRSHVIKTMELFVIINQTRIRHRIVDYRLGSVSRCGPFCQCINPVSNKTSCLLVKASYSTSNAAAVCNNILRCPALYGTYCYHSRI